MPNLSKDDKSADRLLDRSEQKQNTVHDEVQKTFQNTNSVPWRSFLSGKIVKYKVTNLLDYARVPWKTDFYIIWLIIKNIALKWTYENLLPKEQNSKK